MTTPTTATWFDDLPVLGALPPEEAAAKLRQLGETEAAEALEEAETKEVVSYQITRKIRWPFSTKPWQHTAHAFGYLAPAPPGSDPLPIQGAGAIAADPTLKNARVKITLDRLRVADYPGGSTHRVLFDFYAQIRCRGTSSIYTLTPPTASARVRVPLCWATPSLWG